MKTKKNVENYKKKEFYIKQHGGVLNFIQLSKLEKTSESNLFKY